jgi:hypothetical protein
MTWQHALSLFILLAVYVLMHVQGRKIGRQTTMIKLLDALQAEIEDRKEHGRLKEEHMQFAASFFERIKGI